MSSPETNLDVISEEARMAKESVGQLRQRIADLESEKEALLAEVEDLKAQLAECLTQPEPEPEPEPEPPPPDFPAIDVEFTPADSNRIAAVVADKPEGTRYLLKGPGRYDRVSVLLKPGIEFYAEDQVHLHGGGDTRYAFHIGGGKPEGGKIVSLTPARTQDGWDQPLVAEARPPAAKISHYNNPQQFGAIRLGGHTLEEGAPDWLVDGWEITECTGGIRLGVRTTFRRWWLHHLHQLGYSGVAVGSVLEDGELAYCNWLKEYDFSWEAGGGKIVHADPLTVRRIYTHHNWGPGVWTDGANFNVLYEDIFGHDNADALVFHEISGSAVIRRVRSLRNAQKAGGFISGGVKIANCYDVLVEDIYSEEDMAGVVVMHQGRRNTGQTYRRDPAEGNNIRARNLHIVNPFGHPHQGKIFTGAVQDASAIDPSFTDWFFDMARGWSWEGGKYEGEGGFAWRNSPRRSASYWRGIFPGDAV